MMMKSTIYMLGIQLRYYMKLTNDTIQNQMEKNHRHTSSVLLQGPDINFFKNIQTQIQIPALI